MCVLNDCFFFTADVPKKDGVPEAFPGDVLVSVEPDEDKNHLPEKYRRWDNEPPEEFIYFIERIMPAVNPSNNHFWKFNGIKKLSEIYSVQDEAFGLVILLNEFHCWKNKADDAGGTTLYSRKRFVDGKSGNKQGWSMSGINVYMRLCKHIKKRRAEDNSRLMEEALKLEYGKKLPKRNDKRQREEEKADSDFECEDGNELKDQVNNAWKRRCEDKCAV